MGFDLKKLLVGWLLFALENPCERHSNYFIFLGTYVLGLRILITFLELIPLLSAFS